MMVDETLVHTPNLDSHLQFDKRLHPMICQIGGRSPQDCAEATRRVQSYGFSHVNLNIDCPSSRVAGKRQFGAVLMKIEQRDTTRQVIESMVSAAAAAAADSSCSSSCISIKTRVGIDNDDSLDFIHEFITDMVQMGCRYFVLHARKCLLGGLLTPAQNRLVPPLNYPRVYALCRAFPECTFVLNGGIPGLQQAKALVVDGAPLQDEQGEHSVPCPICNVPNGSCTAPPDVVPPNLKGCMMGRAAMDNPSLFWDVDRYFYGSEKNPCRNRRNVLEKYCEYLEEVYPRRCCDGDDRMTRNLLGPKAMDLWEDGAAVGGCSNCCEFYGDFTSTALSTWSPSSVLLRQPLEAPLEVTTHSKPKISSRVIDRSLKPIHGILFGLPKSKTFKRKLDTLSRDLSIRNCGPGYMIRKAMQCVPQELWDKAFTKTEDLQEGDVPVHVSPPPGVCGGS